MTLNSAIYTGTVVHERLRPKRHRLRYSVFSLLLDLDELASLDRSLKLFGHNRGAVFSFRDRDHGNGNEAGLRPWIGEHLRDAGIEFSGGRVRILCYPRIFGYVFNPLSVFFCHDENEELRAILYEVANTHGDKHTYVIPVTDSEGGNVRQSCRKALFVSPFVEMDCEYRFRVVIPRDKVVVSISEHDPEGPLLSAVFAGDRRLLTDGALFRMLVSYPLMTLKVVAGIHFEALRLWLKRVPVVAYQPPAKPISSSIVVATPVTSGEGA